MGKEKNNKTNKKTNNKNIAKEKTKARNKKEEKIIDVEEELVEEIIEETEEELDEEYDEDLNEEIDEDLEEFDDDFEEEETSNKKEKKVEKKNKKKEKVETSKDKDIDTEEVEDIDLEDDDEDTDTEEVEDIDLEDEDTDTEEDLDFLDDEEDIEDEQEEELEEELDFEEEENETPEDEEEVKIKQIKENKKKDKKKKKKEEKEEQKNIKKIEKMAKEKKRKQTSTIYKVLEVLEKYRFQIYAFIAGVLITIFVVMLIWPDRIATLKDGTQPVVKVGGKTYTANNLYENMKDYYSVSLLLDQIDNDLLTKLYPEDEEMTKKIQENAEYYLNMYKQYYNYTQEQFLEKNGFSSYEAFLDYLRLDYRRGKYLDDYIEKNITDNEIQKYYDENIFGDINTQHVLVEVKSNDDDKNKLSDEDAKKLAEEIITKINDGTSWDTIKKDYKDKVTFEDLGYQSWDASLEESFMTALKSMEDNSFSKEPVKTSYGYHVIYRLDQKEKPTLKKVKDKIIEKITAEKKSKDTDLQYKALISLRNEKKIKFSDTVMKSKYDTYCKKYN